MTEKGKLILENFYKYNFIDSNNVAYGLDPSLDYEALIIAPCFNPGIFLDVIECDIEYKYGGDYSESFLVTLSNGKKVAWVKTGAGYNNVVDSMFLCARLEPKKAIFVGSAGALKPEIELGEIYTPNVMIAGNIGYHYLCETEESVLNSIILTPDNMEYIKSVCNSIINSNLNIKIGSVFCTDSIFLEYTLLDDIRSCNTDLIEMETGYFYATAELLGIPAFALLVVSDNSASGKPFFGRNNEDQLKYEEGKLNKLPRMLNIIIDGE